MEKHSHCKINLCLSHIFYMFTLFYRTVRQRLKTDIAELCLKNPGFIPCLNIIQVGAREDSSIYVKMKQRASEEVGIKFKLHSLSNDISQNEVSQPKLKI